MKYKALFGDGGGGGFTPEDEGKVVQDGALVSQTSLSVSENDTYDTTTISSVTVDVPQGGGGGAEENDVMFYDYDGTVLYSYSAADFANLDAMPNIPAHEGLTAQGWNWTLADAKTYVQANGYLDIGALYYVADYATRIVVETPCPNVTATTSISINGTVGFTYDDEPEVEYTGTSISSEQHKEHTFAEAGTHVITIRKKTDATQYGFSGNSTQGSHLFYSHTGVNNKDLVYLSMVRSVVIGQGCELQRYAFCHLHWMKTLILSEGATFKSGESGIFENATALKCLIFPSTVTVLKDEISNMQGLETVSFHKTLTFASSVTLFMNASPKRVIIPPSSTSLQQFNFRNIFYCQTIIIPEGIETMGSNSMQAQYSVMRLTIPSTVTEIGSYAMTNLIGLKELHVKPVAVPTLGTGALDNFPSDCIIYVPASAVEDYKTDANWSTYASQIQAEPS